MVSLRTFFALATIVWLTTTVFAALESDFAMLPAHWPDAAPLDWILFSRPSIEERERRVFCLFRVAHRSDCLRTTVHAPLEAHTVAAAALESAEPSGEPLWHDSASWCSARSDLGYSNSSVCGRPKKNEMMCPAGECVWIFFLRFWDHPGSFFEIIILHDFLEPKKVYS
jgi:hypothetical protein